MIRSGIFEFLSRGLLWGRLLLLAAFMSAEEYGYTVLLISAEAMLGSFISYPQIKDLLMRQHVHIRELKNTYLLFLMVLPISTFCAVLYFLNYLAVIAMLVGALFFGLAQVLLYLHRIDDLSRYNRLKILAACFSTTIFFIVLPIEPLLLPLIQISYFTILVIGFRKDSRFSFVEISEARFSRSQASTWAIFGTQSLISNASVYGNRLIAGAALGLTEVGVFTFNYMVASGVTFYYAAIMIYAEKELSRTLDRADLRTRLRKSASTLAILWGGLGVYGAVGWIVWYVSPTNIRFQVFEILDLTLLIIFFALFALRAVVLVVNPVVIGLGMRRISLVSSFVSGLVLLGLLSITWEIITLNTLVWTMVAASAAQAAVLLWAFVR